MSYRQAVYIYNQHFVVFCEVAGLRRHATHVRMRSCAALTRASLAPSHAL